MPDKTHHTPLPWRVTSFNGETRFVVDKENTLIADTYADTYLELGLPSNEEAKANAELICKAVNNYAILVKALDDLVEDCEGRGIPGIAEDDYAAYYQAKAVLAPIFDVQLTDEE